MIVSTRVVRQSKTNAQDWPKEYVCNFLESGLVSYQDSGAGIAKLSKQAIMDMLPSFIGKPVVIDHVDVTPKDFKEHAVGYITRVWWDDFSGWAYCAFILTDDKAKDKVAQGYSVSCAYDVIPPCGPKGEWHAIRYDEEILKGSGTHLALVTSPRYEECRILVNSKRAMIKDGEGKRNSVTVKIADKSSTNKKEESNMIQLFRKANDKAGSEVDPKDPTKQKWNAETVYVQIENEMVPLSELAKHAVENASEFEPIKNDKGEAQTIENDLEIDGKMQNAQTLIERYKASKAKKNESDEEKSAREKKEKDAKEAENKKNAEDKDKADKDKELQMKKNAEDKAAEEKKNAEEKEKADKEKEKEALEKANNSTNRDPKHFIRLNTAKDNGGVASLTIDTMVNRIERGQDRYGSQTN